MIAWAVEAGLAVGVALLVLGWSLVARCWCWFLRLRVRILVRLTR